MEGSAIPERKEEKKDAPLARRYEFVKDLLKTHEEKLKALADRLLEKEVLVTEDLVAVLGERPWGYGERGSARSSDFRKHSHREHMLGVDVVLLAVKSWLLTVPSPSIPPVSKNGKCNYCNYPLYSLKQIPSQTVSCTVYYSTSARASPLHPLLFEV